MTDSKFVITNDEIKTASVIAGSTARIVALLKMTDGTKITLLNLNNITAIHYTITDLGSYINSTPTVLTDHNNVSITVSDVIITPEQKTYIDGSMEVNFEWTIPNSSPAFPDAGHEYRLDIEFTLANGFLSPIIYKVKAK